MAEPSAAVQAAKSMKDVKSERILELDDGIVVRLTPVSATLIDEVVSFVKDPEVPMFHNDEKDRDEPNPNDPRYLKALELADKQRGIAAMDAMVMFGVEIVSGEPKTDELVTKLKRLERLKRLDLSAYDLEDPIDREFLFKRFVLAVPNLFSQLSELTGLSAVQVEQAERSFPSD